MNDKWDLGYLYNGFDDEHFLSDLDSLKEDGEALTRLLADETVPDDKKMEMLVGETGPAGYFHRVYPGDGCDQRRSQPGR